MTFDTNNETKAPVKDDYSMNVASQLFWRNNCKLACLNGDKLIVEFSREYRITKTETECKTVYAKEIATTRVYLYLLRDNKVHMWVGEHRHNKNTKDNYRQKGKEIALKNAITAMREDCKLGDSAPGKLATKRLWAKFIPWKAKQINDAKVCRRVTAEEKASNKELRKQRLFARRSDVIRKRAKHKERYEALQKQLRKAYEYQQGHDLNNTSLLNGEMRRNITAYVREITPPRMDYFEDIRRQLEQQQYEVEVNTLHACK